MWKIDLKEKWNKKLWIKFDFEPSKFSHNRRKFKFFDKNKKKISETMVEKNSSQQSLTALRHAKGRENSK